MLTNNEIKQIANLHISCIYDGFLSSLGLNFLCQMYKAMDQSKECFIIVEVNGQCIIGFVSGGKGLSSIFKILLKHPFKLFNSLIPQLFNWKVFVGIIKTLFRIFTSRDYKQKLPSNELFSIAVNPSYRRTGVAQVLYHKLCEEFRKRDINEFKIFVGNELQAANSFYIKMGAKPILKIESYRKKKTILYSHKFDI
jgi:ribosomal protein S18 acetylase RimI-like enzyme